MPAGLQCTEQPPQLQLLLEGTGCLQSRGTVQQHCLLQDTAGALRAVVPHGQ